MRVQNNADLFRLKLRRLDDYLNRLEKLESKLLFDRIWLVIDRPIFSTFVVKVCLKKEPMRTTTTRALSPTS